MSVVSSDDETFLIVMMSSIRKCWFCCGDSVFPNFKNCHFAVLQISVTSQFFFCPHYECEGVSIWHYSNFYSNKYTVKPVKFGTLVSKLFVTVGRTSMELACSCNIIHVHYSITWPLVYLELWPQLHI